MDAQTIRGSQLPIVVAGDLNDVGCSYNTRSFQQMCGLHATRQGRGLYSTFSARFYFMR